MLRIGSTCVQVGLDGLDSLTSARNVAVFTYVRHYQFVLAFNTQAPQLRSRDVRRALSEGIDRDALVRDALAGRAIPSRGPIWPQHWAFSADSPGFVFDPQAAAKTLTRVSPSHSLRFTCLVRPDLERVALVMQRQLHAIGVEMDIRATSLDDILLAVEKRDFDAVLNEYVSGPSLFRPYVVWRSGGLVHPGGLGTPSARVGSDPLRNQRQPISHRCRAFNKRLRRPAGHFSGLERAGPGRQPSLRRRRRTGPGYSDHPPILASC